MVYTFKEENFFYENGAPLGPESLAKDIVARAGHGIGCALEEILSFNSKNRKGFTTVVKAFAEALDSRDMDGFQDIAFFGRPLAEIESEAPRKNTAKLKGVFEERNKLRESRSPEVQAMALMLASIDSEGIESIIRSTLPSKENFESSGVENNAKEREVA